MLQNVAVDASPDLAEQLYAEFREPLLGFFLRRVHNRAEAEDLTQDVFVRLIRAGRSDRIENPNAFVFKIATNLLRDRGRAAGRAGITALYPIDAAAEHGAFPGLVEERGPDNVISARKSLDEILRVLADLDARTRDLFILFRLENMQQREHAALLRSAERRVGEGGVSRW